MSDPEASKSAPGSDNPDQIRSALFAQLVVQQSSMAMMLLGKNPHPETGQVIHDLEGARYFIDQLEMLEYKTKGNLNSDEAALLKQSLTALRMAFVESVNAGPPAAEPSAPPAPAGDSKTGSKPPPVAPEAAVEEAEHRKKFTKKY